MMAAATWAQMVHAQATGAVSLASQYSARGVPLSDGRPVPQLSVTYDTSRGAYAGMLASPVILPRYANIVQLIPYAGYASRSPSGLTWDLGAISAVFSGAAEYNYREVYGGLAADQVSGRLSLAPSYYGSGRPSAYGELNAFYPWYAHVKLLGHLGVTHALHAPSAGARDRADIRLAASLDAGGGCNVQLAWLATLGRRPAIGSARSRSPPIAVSASYAF